LLRYWLASIFNSSLREGYLPTLWKTANVIPLPKKHPPRAIKSDIRPISLTPIVAKTFESLVLEFVSSIITDKIDPNQFGSLPGTSTTDALVGMLHEWYSATDKPNNYIRILMLDYSKAFDLINHQILVKKLLDIGLPPHLVRWMAAFLVDREQRVKIGKTYLDLDTQMVESLRVPCAVHKPS
jgi:hypothetical protein